LGISSVVRKDLRVVFANKSSGVPVSPQTMLLATAGVDLPALVNGRAVAIETAVVTFVQVDLMDESRRKVGRIECGLTQTQWIWIVQAEMHFLESRKGMDGLGRISEIIAVCK